MTTPQIYQQLAASQELMAKNLAALTKLQKGNGDHTKAAANVNQATLLHGPGGIFQFPVERDVITAHITPTGVAPLLDKIPSNTTNPLLPYLTGYTDVIGSEPTHSCDDAPYGHMKSCYLTALFGMLRRDTPTIDMNDTILKVNRGDFMDLMLHGGVLGNLQGITPSGLDENQILNNVTMSEMIGVGVQVERALSVRYWQGTVAAGQMPGLDSQIATGQVDARTNTACPALDSDVKDFNYNDVCGTGLDIVQYMSMMEWYLRFNANRMKLMPVTWVISMTPNLWFELSACWPCRYLTYRCQNNTGANAVVINDDINAKMVKAMRDGMFIEINGNRYPVVVDDGIYERNNQNDANLDAGQFASSIYFIPTHIRGNFPSTYINYIDYRLAGSQVSLLRGRENFWWTDNGMFTWAFEDQKWCYKLALKTEQRIVCRTPHLAGKIQRVMYTPLQHLRSPYPDSPYHEDGGVSVRGTTALHAVWN